VSGANGAMRSVTLPDDSQAALELSSGETALVPLGFKAQLPPGFEAQIRMRSSWAFKFGLTLPNAPGTIDADYPDEWMVMMRADRDAVIKHGDRIAQAVIARFAAADWIEGSVGQTSDRAGGFGSTG
jgi:dUTP pyrophosphatase